MIQTFLKRTFHLLASSLIRFSFAAILLIGQTSVSWGEQAAMILFYYNHLPEMSITLKEQPAPFDLSKENTQAIEIDVNAESSYNITVEGVPALLHTNKTDRVPYELTYTTTGKTIKPEEKKPALLIEKGTAGKSTHAINVTVKPGSNLSPGSYTGNFTLSISSAS